MKFSKTLFVISAVLLLAGCNSQNDSSAGGAAADIPDPGPIPTGKPPVLITPPAASCLNQIVTPDNGYEIPDGADYGEAWIDGFSGTYQLTAVQWAVRTTNSRDTLDFAASSDVAQGEPSVNCINNKFSQVFQWHNNSSFPYSIGRTNGVVNQVYQVSSSFEEAETHFTSSILPQTQYRNFADFQEKAASMGADVHVYLTSNTEVDIYVRSVSKNGDTITENRTLAIYQLINSQAGSPLPAPKPAPTATQAPVLPPVTVPTPVVPPTNGKNLRCSIESNYLVIDGSDAVYFGNSDDLLAAFTSLANSGFCSQKGRLGLESNYITLDGHDAFYVSNAKTALEDLLTLYNAGADSANNGRCGIESNYITLNGNDATYYSNIDALLAAYLKLLKTPGACQ